MGFKKKRKLKTVFIATSSKMKRKKVVIVGWQPLSLLFNFLI